MVEELLESEKVRLVDIDYCDSGSSSYVFQIGDKVLKIGSLRNTYKIPNHPRILQPLTRIELLQDDGENTPFACIEIMERVDSVNPGDFLEEEMYKIYKELRDAGIIWTDPRLANLGRLRKDNINILNGEELDVEPKSVGFINGKNKRVLKKGDIVILDTDYIYMQDDPNIYWPNSQYNIFEKSWQRERQAELGKEHNKEQGKTQNSRR